MLRSVLAVIAVFSLVAYLGIEYASILLSERDNPFPEEEGLIFEESSSPPEILEPSILPQEQETGFSVEPLTVRQGGYAVLRAASDDVGALSVTAPFGGAVTWGKTGTGAAAFLPVKYTVSPGEYLVTLSDGVDSQEFTLTVTDGEFPTQALEVDEATLAETAQSEQANTEYFAKAQPVKSVSRDSILWDGDFIWPATGEITTEFGTKRTVNGEDSDQHGGMDIACARGTPVLAANRGEVLFADFLQLTGNTVCIEHGLGLKTWYYHMDSLSVRPGETVEKGEQIGTVGSTGFSTGPHLHFAAAVGTVYIEPRLLLENTPLQ